MATEILKPLMLDDTGQDIVTALNSLVTIMPNLKGEKGDKGDTGEQGVEGKKGDKGDTPVKGTDYWTADDISSIEKDVQTAIQPDIEAIQSDVASTKKEVENKISSMQNTLNTNYLTIPVKNLILSLFENAVYNNANMKSALDELKLAWAETDNYGTLLYKLSSKVVLDGSTYIDTGVKLFEDGASGNFTIVCAFTTPITCAQGMPKSLFTCEYDAGQGVMVRMASEGTWTAYGGSGAFNFDDNSFSYAGKTVAEILNGDGTMNVIAVAKDGDNWYFWLNGYLAWNSPLGYAFSATIPEDLTLIFGARQSYDGKSIEYKTAYTLNDARVYNSVLTTDQINSIISDLKGV
jgi:hypothetical protein